MKTKHFLLFVVAIACATAFARHNYQCYSNTIGDWKILTLGGYTLAEPMVVDLAPTNAPDANARYSLRCQVAYKDNVIPRPTSEAEFELVLKIAGVMNSWLKDFIDQEYVGAEYEELLKAYKSGSVRKDLAKKFPDYVAAQISAMDPSGRPDIETVTVDIEAVGAFRDELIKEMEKESPAEQEEQEE